MVNTTNASTRAIYFARIPRLGEGKTRLIGILNKKQVYEITKRLFFSNLELLCKCFSEVTICYDGDTDDLRDFKKIITEKFPETKINYVKQNGKDLGEKMSNAIRLYDGQVVLLGSDLVSIDERKIYNVLNSLDEHDVVFLKTTDGGFGLVAMNGFYDLLENIEYSTSKVMSDLEEKAKLNNVDLFVSDCISDIDDFLDLVKYESKSKSVELIGAGEYNINYLTDKGTVFRINTKSQLNLGKKQIEYEYNALKTLEETEIVPKVYYFKEEGDLLPYGFLEMEFLKGRALDYDKDLDRAAYLLAKLHGASAKGNFIEAKEPFKMMYEEFISMFSVYENFKDSNEGTLKRIRKMLYVAKSMGLDNPLNNKCIISTELNNRNFIIGDERSYIIDFEKPLLGEREQDLAHFCVPTTTNWKTEKILTKEEINTFLDKYDSYSEIKCNRKLFNKYFVFNTLRGVTWCSMAKVEYATERSLTNEETLKKINKFLSDEFLDYLYKNFYEV